MAWAIVAIMNAVILFMWYPAWATSSTWQIIAPLSALILVPAYIWRQGRLNRYEKALPRRITEINKMSPASEGEDESDPKRSYS
jgi:hypothetical protein